MMPTILKPIDKLINCFRSDGPLGLDYSEYQCYHDKMGEMSETMHMKYMFTDMMKSMGNGIEEMLIKGVKMLDVGCGNGFHLAKLAEKFPNSSFTGLDIDTKAIEFAKSRRTNSGQKWKNLEFVAQDAGKMDDKWTAKFDIVMIFDACHDQMRPDLCIQNIHRVLKKDGVFAMVEVNEYSNAYEDREKIGMSACLTYGCSMFLCLPVGSNREDAMCYGAMWGRKRAEKLLNDCGFDNVRIVETPYCSFNILYVSKK